SVPDCRASAFSALARLPGGICNSPADAGAAVTTMALEMHSATKKVEAVLVMVLPNVFNSYCRTQDDKSVAVRIVACGARSRWIARTRTDLSVRTNEASSSPHGARAKLRHAAIGRKSAPET